MSRVDVEEPAAVSAELLDRDLRSSGTKRNHLLLHFRFLSHGISLFILYRVALGVELWIVIGDGLGELDRLILAEGLHNTLGDQEQRPDQCKGHQDVESTTRKINPKVSNSLSRASLEPADKSNEHSHTCGG